MDRLPKGPSLAPQPCDERVADWRNGAVLGNSINLSTECPTTNTGDSMGEGDARPIANHERIQSDASMESSVTAQDCTVEDIDDKLISEPEQLPTCLSLLKYHIEVGPFVVLVLTVLLGLVLARLDSAAAQWYPTGYTPLIVAAWVTTLVWQNAASINRERRVLQGIGDYVSQIYDADDGPQGSRSEDLRLHYIQNRIQYSSRRTSYLQKECQKRISNPLHFLSQELHGWRDSEHGYIVTDKTGVMLWNNNAIADALGFQNAELHGENVRMLMPAPYSEQHDHFLRKYLETGTRNIIGTERSVPVLRKDGTRSIVHLIVEDRLDPYSFENRLFVGRMRFKIADPAYAALCAVAARRKCNLLDFDQQLGSKLDPVVVIRVDGIVEYANNATKKLFGWDFEELHDQNVKKLMPEPFAGRHDYFLQRYNKRAEEAALRGEVPTSCVVGSGRDVIGKHKDGSSFRIFLMVERIDMPSGKASDRLFMGTMVLVQDGVESVSLASNSASGRLSSSRASAASPNESAKDPANLDVPCTERMRGSLGICSLLPSDGLRCAPQRACPMCAHRACHLCPVVCVGPLRNAVFSSGGLRRPAAPVTSPISRWTPPGG